MKSNEFTRLSAPGSYRVYWHVSADEEYVHESIFNFNESGRLACDALVTRISDAFKAGKQMDMTRWQKLGQQNDSGYTA